MDQHLKTERRRLVDAWHTYQTRHDQGGAEAPGPEIPPELLASWQRSALSVPPDRVSAPLDDEPETVSAWADSQLEFALRPLLPELRAVAAEGDLIVAVADASGKLTWTEGSRRMTPLARGINFVPGSHWDEPSVGTNALALALRHVKPVRVFAAEHYVQTVHDWVCYSSPIRHPQTRELLGVLDFSTTWEHATPLGLAGAQYFARRIEQNLLADGGRSGDTGLECLSLKLCGPPEVRLGRQTLHLTRRQHELLAVLALNPAGLSPDVLHAHVYGDQMVSMSTVKSEISTLRGLLGGAIASRPYRLMLGVTFDVHLIEAALLAGQVGLALDHYLGPLLPHSDGSPLLRYWHDYLDGALRQAVLRTEDPEMLWRYSQRFDDLEVLAALDGLLPTDDPRRPVLRARLGALVAN
jgi:hypothetical protein